MANLIFKAFAKLNLSLNILPLRGEKGYFHVRFINIQTELHDRVKIALSPDDRIHVKNIVLENEVDITYHAAQIIKQRYSLSAGVIIDIEKNIPTKAGLGGGSADAAAVINGMERLFGLHIPPQEKIFLAKTLGMDVCYCVIGGLCKIEGIGDEVHPLVHRLPMLDILIATPPQKKPSTSWAYSILREDEIGKSMHKYDRLLKGIRKGNKGLIASNLHNDFEVPIRELYPITGHMKNTMLNNGALGAILAGSGLSVFGIFDRRESMMDARELLVKMGITCIPSRILYQYDNPLFK